MIKQMRNLQTTYLGMPISTPVVVGSCGLTSSVQSIVNLAEHGAGAIVLKSVFEEEILLDYEHNVLPNIGPMQNDLEFFDYYDYEIKHEVLQKYVGIISDVKARVNIPVIASINCISSNEWVSYALRLQEAGADALELNILKLPFDEKHSSAQIEDLYIQIIEKVRQRLSIPIAVKIGPQFTNLGVFVKRLADAGVEGIVMFNRYYPIDFDIHNEEIIAGSVFSHPSDYLLPLRWISILSNRVDCELIASTGVHSVESAVKMLLAGASSVQVVSGVYKQGPLFVKNLVAGIESWMENKGYSSLGDFKGNLAQTMADKSDIFERVQFMRHFGDHRHNDTL
jgi:dihydroorotate dehydrogenase (fumarate)